MTVVDVAAPLAALGTTIQVPTLDGDVPLEVPAGTQPGETIVMAGAGCRRSGAAARRPAGRDQRRHPAAAEPQAARPARAVRRLAEEENLREEEGMLAKLKRALAG